MKLSFWAAIMALATMGMAGQAWAQSPPPPAAVKTVAAPAEPDALPLYGDRTPGSIASEAWVSMMGSPPMVRNVTRPTLTPVLPDPAKATGAAAVVAPGGAFMMLSMESEGWRVARALADRGIAAFVLKYRLIPTPRENKDLLGFMAQRMTGVRADPTKMPTLRNDASTTDALAALALVRANSGKWDVDPHRVGIIGFSAGAMTALDTVLTAKPGEGPAFVGYVYGPQAQVQVPPVAPPLFDAIAFDDPLFPSMGFPLAAAWHAAKRPVELHAYQKGGHGFGTGIAGTTTSLVIDQFTAWLSMQGFLTSPRAAQK